jgi:hypothetical protein
MRRLHLPDPPDPDSGQYRDNPLSFSRAIRQWGALWKGRLEDDSRSTDKPCSQPMLATSFTTSSVISGTATGTDVTNVLCTLIQTLTDRGILTSKATNA